MEVIEGQPRPRCADELPSCRLMASLCRRLVLKVCLHVAQEKETLFLESTHGNMQRLTKI